MNILSIQSSVAYGHVGNAAAVLPLQRLGHEVWAIHTVQFSNHPGYGAWRGEVFAAKHIAELVAGIDERGALARCAAVLSGYLGEAATGGAVLDAVARTRAANPAALYCCDPVMGDDRGGIFVRRGIPEFFAARGVPAADIVTPNRFELEHLTGTPVGDSGALRSATRALLALGPRLVAVTGLRPPLSPPGRIGTLAATRDGAWLVTTPELTFDPAPNGMGDAFAALLLGHLLSGAAPPEALSLAVSGLFAVLEHGVQEGQREMPLVAAQEALIDPPVIHRAEPIFDWADPS